MAKFVNLKMKPKSHWGLFDFSFSTAVCLQFSGMSSPMQLLRFGESSLTFGALGPGFLYFIRVEPRWPRKLEEWTGDWTQIALKLQWEKRRKM